MLKFSTDELPPHERFAHWREVRAQNIYGVTIELEKALQPAFRGTFSAIKVGEATLIEMHASSYQVSRSWADIANAPSDSLCIYQQLDGENWFDTGRHGEFVIAAGALGTSYSDLPYVTTPTKQSGFHLRLLKIPFARCKGITERARRSLKLETASMDLNVSGASDRSRRTPGDTRAPNGSVNFRKNCRNRGCLAS